MYPKASRQLVVFVLFLSIYWVSAPAFAVTVTVGNGGCQYIGLQFALDELASQPGPHVLKLKTQTIAIPNGLVLNTSGTSYTFIGGHSACSDATPTAGQRTVLDAEGGNDGTAIALNSSSSSATPSVIFRGVTVRGGSPEGGIGANPEGGGLEVRGRLLVQLNAATRIEHNETNKGGGVYLRGNNSSERATLHVLGDSEIFFNNADDFGGGIYCDQQGTVLLDHGRISQNGSNRGGGAYMADTCTFDAQVQAGTRTGFFENFAIESGGALYVVGSNSLSLRGVQSAPFWFDNNLASEGFGGALIHVNQGARTTTTLQNVVWVGNRAGTGASALMLIGAIDATLQQRNGTSNCGFPGIGYGACAAVVGNLVPSGVGYFFGAVHLEKSLAGASPTLTVRNTAFIGNRGRSLFSARGPGRFDIAGAIIQGNHLTSGTTNNPSTLLWIETEGFDPIPPGLQQRLRFSTVVGTTADGSASTLFDHDVSGLDLTGSIVHSPGLAEPQQRQQRDGGPQRLPAGSRCRWLPNHARTAVSRRARSCCRFDADACVRRTRPLRQRTR
jgi:predicted outer membrane repeat protein